MPDSLNNLPVELWAGKCSDADFQKYLVGVHALSFVNFKAAIEKFAPLTLPPKIYSTKGINGIYSAINVDCENHVVDLEYDENDDTSHQDITFSIGAPAVANYSIAFFNGLKRLFSTADEFHFYKAITKAGAPPRANDVIFAIVTNGKVVYLGDYSDLLP